MDDMQVIAEVPDGQIMIGNAASLGRWVSAALKASSGDIRLDFTGVVAASPSAACRFFDTIRREAPCGSVERIIFLNASPWISESFEEGYAHIFSRSGTRETA